MINIRCGPGLLGVTFLALACSPTPSQPDRQARNTTHISGTLLEQVDGPPHTYLRLRTGTGEVWAAVPVTGALDRTRPLELTNCIPVRGHDAKELGRKLDQISFCALPPAR